MLLELGAVKKLLCILNFFPSFNGMSFQSTKMKGYAMMPMLITSIVVVFIAPLTVVNIAFGQVTEFDLDRPGWEAASGPFTTIGFTEDFPDLITNQYTDLGVTFTDGNDFILCCGGFDSFVVDGAGLDGSLIDGQITIAFTDPQFWLAFEFPDRIRIELFSEGQSIFFSSILGGSNPIGNFAGVVSDVPFDMARITDPFFDLDVRIDDLLFGGAVPAPGMVALLGLAGLFGRTRRRRC